MGTVPECKSWAMARRRSRPNDVVAQLRPATHEQLRAMSHPLRIRLLEALARHGSATASQLARELGESSGATSYHLRVLAKAKLIEEDPEQPSGRERRWRDLSVFVGVRRGSEDPTERAAEAAIRAVDVERSDQALARLVAEEDRLDPAWRRARSTATGCHWGSADEQKPAADGTVKAWARSETNPVKGWYGLKKGMRGRFANYVPPVLEELGLAEVEHNPRNNRMRAR